MRLAFLVFLLVTIGFNANASMTEFRAAESLLYARKTSSAIPKLAELCETDTLRACSLLGFAYISGRYGVKKDEEEGLLWYKKCAESEKNFFCHNEIGKFYSRHAEYDKALEYYKKGASAGNAESQYWLGRFYLEGKAVHPNSETALRWFRKAAHARKNPSTPAQCILVEMSYYGIGMRPSAKDTNYWLKKCDNPFIRALRSFYGHGVPKNRTEAKEIMKQAKLSEALNDWKDFTGTGQNSVGKNVTRDQVMPEDCYKKEQVFGAGRKNPNIETYGVKIFSSDFYRTFNVRDGYVEKIGGGDQTFEACGMTFYTTLENKRLLTRSLRDKAIIKIGLYKNACLGADMKYVCVLNLPWKDPVDQDDTDIDLEAEIQ